MTEPRPKDTRDIVDGFVHRHQLDYSLAQLRLAGLLLLAVALGSLLLAVGIGGFEPPVHRLGGMIGLSPILPLLPLGFALQLLGGGHRRHRREHLWIPALHRSLLPLGLIVLVLLPAITIHDAALLTTEHRQALRDRQERRNSELENLERVQAARSAEEIARLGRAQGLTIPAGPAEPKAVGLWRYEVSLERQRREEEAMTSRPSSSPMPLELLQPVRLLTTLLLQGVSGGGLLLLRGQGLRMMRRMGLTPDQFFCTDATGPVRQRRGPTDRSRRDPSKLRLPDGP